MAFGWCKKCGSSGQHTAIRGPETVEVWHGSVLEDARVQHMACQSGWGTLQGHSTLGIQARAVMCHSVSDDGSRPSNPLTPTPGDEQETRICHTELLQGWGSRVQTEGAGWIEHGMWTSLEGVARLHCLRAGAPKCSGVSAPSHRTLKIGPQ